MTTLPNIVCTDCGDADLASVAPGTEAETAADPFTVRREIPVRAWCWRWGHPRVGGGRP